MAGPSAAAQHFQALLLATASSTDNLLVGLSVGLSDKHLPQYVLWGISVCNAAGCWFATTAGGEGGLGYVIALVFGGNSGSGDHHRQEEEDSHTGVVQNTLAAAAFAYLAYQEHREQRQQQQQQQQQQDEKNKKARNDKERNSRKHKQASLQLALPMTLNNLAGGVTGGVMGLSPTLNALYALGVSVATMWVGHVVGRACARQQKKLNSQTENQLYNRNYNLANVSIALYLILSLYSLYEACEASILS